ncbi:MAG TPA: dienelactone hydrolase family protein, partial [Synergistales bacterium]|nr:dienelactone hydrolase family protein [Synergistales bacterium]
MSLKKVWRGMLCLVLVFFLLLAATGGEAGMIREEHVEYRHKEAVLEGFVCYDETMEGIRPGIIVVHEWTGINEYILERCRMLAEFGYVAFAADIYGKGIRPQTREEASRQASIYRGDRKLMRDRVNAALAEIGKHPMTDTSRIATIGY